MHLRQFLIAAVMPLAACVSNQLKDNTLATAATVEDIRVAQLLNNVSHAIDDPDAVPSQLILPNGVTADSEGGGGTLGFAFHWIKSGSVNATANESNNWAVSPISDPRDLLNLRGLYSLLY